MTRSSFRSQPDPVSARSLTAPALAATLAVTLAAGACAPRIETESEPERPTQQYTIEQFLGTTAYHGASFSPDREKLLVSSDASGVFNAYAVPVAGGEPVQLTHSTDDAIFAAGYFPADERFLYLQDDGGNELSHVYVAQPRGETVDLTPGEGLRASFLGWSDDDRYFYIATNERDERYFDVYEYSIESFDRELIFQNDSGLDFADISADRRRLALSKTVSNADSDAYLYDRDSGELVHLTPHEGIANHWPLEFTPGGGGLLMLTDRDSEFSYLVEQPLADGAPAGEWRVLRRPDWDVQFAGFSDGGRYLVVGVNEDARTRLEIEDRESGEPLPLPEVPNAEISSVAFSADETHLAFYASSSQVPRDLFVVRLDGALDRGTVAATDGEEPETRADAGAAADPDSEGRAPRRLTRSLNPAIDPDDLVVAEVVRFESTDGIEIPGILYRPHQASEDEPVGALVWVHGGPGGQSRVGYSSLIQYLANHGYAVYAVNNRGSSGYGKTFYHLDDRAHGEGDLDDCVAAGEMLRQTGWVDPDRVGIIGGSYGGYMVLAALAFRSEAFAAGVDLFGVSNWHRTVQSIPPWWESFRVALEAEMGDFDDEEYFRSISPLFHADRIQRPLMVLQGANDPRVLKAESDEIVAAVEANGVPVEYLVFDDEGHGFVKKENREKGYRAILDFLDRHLRPQAE